jgi:hypothetical protein
MASLRRGRTAAVVLGLLALSSLGGGCRSSLLPASSNAGASGASGGGIDAVDAGATGDGAPQTKFGAAVPDPWALPPPVPAGLMFQPCGGMEHRPELLGIDADGDVVLLAAGFASTESIHLYSRTRGRVVRTINVGASVGTLTGDRLHVLTPIGIVDLRTGGLRVWAAGGTPGTGLMAAGPAGEPVLSAQGDGSSTGPPWFGATYLDGRRLELALPAGAQALAAAVTGDGQRAVVHFSANGVRGTALAVLRLSDGALERQIPVWDGTPGGVHHDFGPLLAISGDVALVNIADVGYRAFRISDGALLWARGPEIAQAVLSPEPGVLAFRSDTAGPWVKSDVVGGRALGTFAASEASNASSDQSVFARPLLAFSPDGSELAFALGDGLSIGRADGSATPLPFRQGGWAGQAAFVSATEVVSVEMASSSPTFEIAVRKHGVPGGEILAEFTSGESQSEWDGDIAVSPDGRAIAVAFPDSTRLLWTADLSPIGIIPTAASRVAWSSDGTRVLTTPDRHYRDVGRPPPELHAAVDVWTLSGKLDRTYPLPFVPFFATFTGDGRTIVATGRAANPVDSTVSMPRIVLTGPLQSARIDRETGDTRVPDANVLAADPSGRFGTDLSSLIRLVDGHPIASLVGPLPGVVPAAGADGPGVGEARGYHAPIFSPDGALLVGVDPIAEGTLPQLVFIAPASGERVQTFPLQACGEADADVVTLAFSPDGRRLAVGPWGGFGTLYFACLAP